MKIKKLLITSLMIIPLIVTGCSRPRAETKKPHAEEQDKGTAVEVMEVEKKALTNEYNTAGKLYASEEVNVSSEAKGKVKSINFNIGDEVKKGD
ncbi:MAG: efflux RND transporter periplasmic adaptor subunit, partial [Bacteroidales bacterium]|nr:efflux RND transporter periplasmic adaptor subunit [Bacteroidales bacterium]